MSAPADSITSGAAAITPIGQFRFFKEQNFHFQALRVFSDIPFGGADTSEALYAITQIRDGDAGSWFDAWSATGRRNAARAEACLDRVSSGMAWLRAHSYWRTSEFLLKPSDPRRMEAWEAQVNAFDRGLADLDVVHHRFDVPYETGSLRAIFYPGPPGWEKKPLILYVGGFDSTLEELYFFLVKAAYLRGYGVLTYEGPGQGTAIRKFGLTFTHEWERPNTAVLDAYLASHPAPPKIILVGMSMGGYLAPRAAAFESRVDGVVAFDVFYDCHETALIIDKLRKNPVTQNASSVVWALDNAMWTHGFSDPDDFVKIVEPYTLAPVASLIKGDVLILAGGEDHFIPVKQVSDFENACTGARSVESVVFDRESGGAEHCQLGANTLWHEVFFDWIIRRFPSKETEAR